MSLATQLRSALAPVVAQLVGTEGFGSTVTLRRATLSAAADNSQVKTWGTPAGGAGLGCTLQDITVEQSQRDWGTTPVTTAVGYMADAVDVIAMDGLQVTAGDRAGTNFKVTKVNPIRVGGLLVVGLATTAETFA